MSVVPRQIVVAGGGAKATRPTCATPSSSTTGWYASPCRRRPAPSRCARSWLRPWDRRWRPPALGCGQPVLERGFGHLRSAGRNRQLNRLLNHWARRVFGGMLVRRCGQAGIAVREVWGGCSTTIGNRRVPEGPGGRRRGTPGAHGTPFRPSEGNPLFFVAALETMRKQNLLSSEDGRLILRAPIEKVELVMPNDLRAIIGAQIQRLPDREIQALEIASVTGASFSAAVTAWADGSDMQELEDLYEALSKRHRFLRWASTHGYPEGTLAERYEFSHALYRRVLYERIAPVRRAAYHRAIGERIEGLYAARIDDVVSELAFFFDVGGDHVRCVEYLRRSAEITGRRRAHQATTTMLHRAREVLPKLPKADRVEIEIRILIAPAGHRMSTFDPGVVDAYETLPCSADLHGPRHRMEQRAAVAG